MAEQDPPYAWKEPRCRYHPSPCNSCFSMGTGEGCGVGKTIDWDTIDWDKVKERLAQIRGGHLREQKVAMKWPYSIYVGLDGHLYIRGLFGFLMWRSPWRVQ